MHVMQAVTQQLWKCAVVAYEALRNQEALVTAWTWMSDQRHDWITTSPASHVCLLLAVAAIHHQPSQGQHTITHQPFLCPYMSW